MVQMMDQSVSSWVMTLLSTSSAPAVWLGGRDQGTGNWAWKDGTELCKSYMEDTVNM